MKNFISAVLLLFFFYGCADTITNNPADADIKIEIKKPLSNDSVGYRGDKIDYELTASEGINFIELYINNTFIKNFPPVNNQKPVIYFEIDSVLTGQRAELYLLYYDKNGSSVKSNIVKNILITEDRSLPYTPFNINVVRISSTTLNISWQDTSRNIKEYEIWRRSGNEGNFVKQITAPADSRNINDNNLSSGQSYFYKIRGLSRNGYSDFSDIRSSEGSNSKAPSNLIAEIKDFKVVQLKWDDKSTDENYFKVERRREWSLFETVGYAEKDKESFTDSGTGISGGYEYYYRVTAVSSSDSSWSNEAYIFMPAYLLKAPTILSADNITSEKVSIRWRDNDNNYADFYIERKTPGKNFIEIGKATAFVYSFTDTVHPGQTYTYRIKQDDGIYTSSYTDDVTVNASVIQPQIPQNLNGYYDGNSMIISWEYTSDADKFIIERRDSTLGNSFTQLAAPSGTERQYTDITTECQHIYVYRIKAADKYSSSSFSSEKVIKNWKICP